MPGINDPDVASSLIEVAIARAFERDPVAAEAIFREAFEIRRKKLYAGHPDTAAAEVRLEEALTEEGKASEAEPLLREALAALNGERFAVQPWRWPTPMLNWESAFESWDARGTVNPWSKPASPDWACIPSPPCAAGRFIWHHCQSRIPERELHPAQPLGQSRVLHPGQRLALCCPIHEE